MNSVTSNGPDLYAQICHRIREAMGEFNDDNQSIESLIYALEENSREYAAHLAQPAEWPSQEDVARDVGRRLFNGLLSTQLSEREVRDAVVAALQSVRPPAGAVSDYEWLKLADELEAFKPRGELGALHGAGMAFAYADAAKTIRAKVKASRHTPTKD